MLQIQLLRRQLLLELKVLKPAGVVCQLLVSHLCFYYEKAPSLSANHKKYKFSNISTRQDLHLIPW